MDDKNKGLADTQEGGIILNESGSSVTTDVIEGVNHTPPHDQTNEDKKNLSNKEEEEENSDAKE